MSTYRSPMDQWRCGARSDIQIDFEQRLFAAVENADATSGDFCVRALSLMTSAWAFFKECANSDTPMPFEFLPQDLRGEVHANEETKRR